MYSSESEPVQNAANELMKSGHAIIKLHKDTLSILDQAMRLATPFFDQSSSAKLRYSSPFLQEGYLEFGAEKDKVTGQPDLSESFKAWFRNIGNSTVDPWLHDCEFYRAMRSALAPYAELAEAVLIALRSRVSGQSVAELGLDLRSASYTQMNFSRPAQENRDSIMDLHEDGHLLTIVRPSKGGLRGCRGRRLSAPSDDDPIGIFAPEGDLLPVELEVDEAILFAGTPTYYITGGYVPPFFHMVARSDAHVRQSIMLFANPAQTDLVEPWIKNIINENVSIRQIVDNITYSHLHRHDWIGESED